MYRHNGKVVGYRAVPAADGLGEPAEIRVRTLRPHHRDEVRAIDWLTRDAATTDGDLRRLLRDPLRAGMVAIVNKTVVGFVAGCEIWNELEIARLATKPGWRRMGIARSILNRLKYGRDDQARLDRIFVPVREGNLDAQLFLKAQGFVCGRIIHRGERIDYEFLWSRESGRPTFRPILAPHPSDLRKDDP